MGSVGICLVDALPGSMNSQRCKLGDKRWE